MNWWTFLRGLFLLLFATNYMYNKLYNGLEEFYETVPVLFRTGKRIIFDFTGYWKIGFALIWINNLGIDGWDQTSLKANLCEPSDLLTEGSFLL